MDPSSPFGWDDLKMVLALERARTFPAAARALGVDRTTVARRVQALQRVLGTRLLVRRGEGMHLTTAGRAIAARAAEMEAAALAVAHDLAAGEQRVAGTVRVAATEALGAALLAAPLSALCARHPGLTVELSLEPRAVSLARGEADLAVRLLPPTEATSIGKRMGQVAYGAYAAREAEGRPGRGARGLLIWSAPIAGEETAWLARASAGARVLLRSNSTAALAAGVAGGEGVAVLPCFVGDADVRLRRLDAPGEIPASPLWLVSHRDLRRSARVAAVWGELERVLSAARRALLGRSGRAAGQVGPAVGVGGGTGL